VVDNIRRIASLVSEVGTKCVNEKLEMNELPRGLHAIFETLETYVRHEFLMPILLIDCVQVNWLGTRKTMERL
jgi:hypothetical protein